LGLTVALQMSPTALAFERILAIGSQVSLGIIMNLLNYGIRSAAGVVAISTVNSLNTMATHC